MFYGNGKFGFKSIGIEVSEVGEKAHNFNSVSFLFNFFKHYQLFFQMKFQHFLPWYQNWAMMKSQIIQNTRKCLKVD